MVNICLYHGSDIDGICSAAIVKLSNPDTILIPAEYGIKVKIDDIVSDGDTVIIVDFVLQPFSEMKRLSEKAHIIWIDHHNTAIEDYNEYISSGVIEPLNGVRNVKLSACELAWNWFNPNIPLPYSVFLLGRYDVWAHGESKSILPFQYGMKLNHEPPENMEFWKNVFSSPRDSDTIQTIIRQGKTIMRYRAKLNEKLCELQSFKSSLMGYSCICINRALSGSSIFDSLKNREEYDIMVTFYICSRGAWNVSMYSIKPEVNVGEIAKLFGGGGHANAAGFRCTILPFEVSP